MNDYELYWSTFHAILGLTSLLGIFFLIGTSFGPKRDRYIENIPAMMVETRNITHHDIIKLNRVLTLSNEYEMIPDEYKERAYERGVYNLRRALAEDIAKHIDVREVPPSFTNLYHTMLSANIGIVKLSVT